MKCPAGVDEQFLTIPEPSFPCKVGHQLTMAFARQIKNTSRDLLARIRELELENKEIRLAGNKPHWQQ